MKPGLNAYLRRALRWLREWLPTREGRWTLGLGAAGVVLGLFTGGMGLALLGTAVALKGWVVLGGLFALVGNRIGVSKPWAKRALDGHTALPHNGAKRAS